MPKKFCEMGHRSNKGVSFTTEENVLIFTNVNQSRSVQGDQIGCFSPIRQHLKAHYDFMKKMK
jgi:hypothetical protein